MDKLTAFATKTKDFAMSRPLEAGSIIIAILAVIILAIYFVSRESFEGMVTGVKSLAEYPAAFADVILPDFVKDTVYDNYFTKPSEKVMPMDTPSTQLELPTHSVSVPIDIGNGMAVNAMVQIPSQTVTVPEQSPVTLPEAQKTDVLVATQQVQIPAQAGIIPGTIEGSDSIMSVPVEIPAQIVSIPEQLATIPVMEPFRM